MKRLKSTVRLGCFLFSVLTAFGGFGIEKSFAESSDNKDVQQECEILLTTGSIPKEWIRAMAEADEDLSAEKKRLRDSVQSVGFENIALNRDILKHHNSQYTFELTQGPQTNQMQSGRCWIFAGLNMLCSRLVGDGKVSKDFHFSPNYLYFFHVLESVNDYLEDILDLRDTEFQHHQHERFALTPQLQDGGWFEYFKLLVEKYGVVPDHTMPETLSSLSTGKLQAEIKRQMAVSAFQLSDVMQKIEAHNAQIQEGQLELGFAGSLPANASTEPSQGKSVTKISDAETLKILRQVKLESMESIWKILATHLGVPPSEFELRLSGKQKKDGNKIETPAQVQYFTPKEFTKDFVGFHSEDYVVVTASPFYDSNAVFEYNKSGLTPATADEQVPLRYFNVELDRMEILVAEALKGGQPVWFAADVSHDIHNQTGVMHPEIFDREALYPFEEHEKSDMDRAYRMYYMLGGPNHAMLMTGFDQPYEGESIVKFKVENSWGAKAGDNGIYHMYREWFEEHVYQVVIHKDFLTKEERALWEGKAQDLPSGLRFF
jgi:bleomycin hydrolase